MVSPFRATALVLIWSGLHMMACANWDLTVLKTFEKPGAHPLGTLVRHADGSFYGTTPADGANGAGTIFRISGGNLETLHHFQTSEGSGSVSPLVIGPGGMLVGTASAGGMLGYGSVFTYQTATGEFGKWVDFDGTHGSVPEGLLYHTDGSFYGLTRGGGAQGHGTVFKLTASGVLSTLHSFSGTNGSEPVGSLVAVVNQLYGLTRVGGSGSMGTAFRIHTTGIFESLFSFTGTTGLRPGANPSAGWMLHSSGKLFGMTEYGGTAGFGAAFSITSTTMPVFTLLRSFSDPSGSQPSARFVEGSDTNLYGTTASGGTSGIGTLFRMTPTGGYSVLHYFSGPDGAAPRAGLVADPSGLLHGITSAGGAGELGRAFTLTPTGGVFTATASLSPTDGFMPSGGPIADASGNFLLPLAGGGVLGGGTVLSYDPLLETFTPSPLGAGTGDAPDGGLLPHNGTFYGVCARGGASARGSAFSWTSAGGASLLGSFNTTQGSLPEGPLIAGGDGALYGVSREGGATARGTFYKITTAGTRTRIFSFTGTTGTHPGREPRGPLVRAANQSFYGVTSLGGTANVGVIYKLNPLGAYSVIADFTASGPRLPQGGLVIGGDGMIYGTCSAGGSLNGGALIRIQPSTDTWSVVASFDPALGSSPGGPMLAAADRTVWGFTTSSNGGVFRYLAGLGLEIIANFTGNSGARPGRSSATDDHALIHHGGLVQRPDGSILGLVPGGGTTGGGVLFQLTPTSPLGSWKLAELGDPDAPDLGDPDEDGLANLVEYALGSNPTQSSPEASPPATTEDGFLQLIVPRDPSKNDVSITVQVASDPAGPWSALASSTAGQPFDGPGYLSGDASTPGLKSVIIRDVLPVSSELRRFLRLAVAH